jgi:hypothetical protein
MELDLELGLDYQIILLELELGLGLDYQIIH